MIDLIYEQEFYEIKSASIEIRNIPGTGFLEKVYENALKIELEERGLELKNVNEITGISKPLQQEFVRVRSVRCLVK